MRNAVDIFIILDFDLKYVQENGFKKPILFKSKIGLGMRYVVKSTMCLKSLISAIQYLFLTLDLLDGILSNLVHWSVSCWFVCRWFVFKYLRDYSLVFLKICMKLMVKKCESYDFCLNLGLMGEGFILLTRGYGFMGGVPPPFDMLKKCTFAYDMNLKLYR